MSEALFDDRARALRRRRALVRDSRPFLAERIVDDLAERLSLVLRPFERALVTGCPPGLHERVQHVASHVAFAHSIDALADLADGSLDVLLIIGELDTREELPTLLRIARSRIRAGGLVAGAIAGGDSLPNLRRAMGTADRELGRFAPRTHPRIEPSALAGLLNAAGLMEPVVDVDRIVLRYESLWKLVSDLRDHAATNCLAARPRHGLSRAAARIAERAFLSDPVNGRAEERIDLLHFAAWASDDG